MGNPTEKHNGAGPLPNTTIQLVINFDQMTGQLGIQGPVQNAMLCYGMLELAKDAVREYKAKLAENKILQPAPGLKVV